MLTLFFVCFFSNPVFFKGQSYRKQKGPRMTLLVKYYQIKFEYIIQSGFEVIPKITSVNLSKPISDIINHSTFICLFEFGNCGKGREKNTKIKYLKNGKSF